MAFVREPARTTRFMMNEALSAQAFLATEYPGEKASIARVKSAETLLAKLTLLGGLSMGVAGQAHLQSCALPLLRWTRTARSAFCPYLLLAKQ